MPHFELTSQQINDYLHAVPWWPQFEKDCFRGSSGLVREPVVSSRSPEKVVNIAIQNFVDCSGFHYTRECTTHTKNMQLKLSPLFCCVLCFWFPCKYHTSVLVWFCPCELGLPCSSASPPVIPLSTSRESMLEAEAHAELMLERWDWASCSQAVPTEPVLRCCLPPDDPEEGRRKAVEDTEDEEDEVEEEEEVWRAASSMLREAFSSWEVMSSREILEAADRELALPPRTVLAGDALALLLVLPEGNV